MRIIINATDGNAMMLSELPTHAHAVVAHVADTLVADSISQRLRDLGFVPGEPVRVVARAPFGGDPILVQVGSTRFALRRSEAHRVVLQPETSHD